MLPLEQGEADGIVKILTIHRQAKNKRVAESSQGARGVGVRIWLISGEIRQAASLSFMPRLIGDFGAWNRSKMVPLLLHG
jgi:hypothetical protein